MVSERLVRAGQYLSVGTQVISLVPLPNVWVIANYKETQMTNIRTGQKARVAADRPAIRARQSSLNSGEYLLYCTRDEKHWTSWRVQTASHKLRGPDKLIEGIPLPDPYYR
jgi:hypothetical protein